MSRPDRERAPGCLTIAFVIGSLNRGGAERQLLLLARGVVERGHRVRVLCLEEEGAMAKAARAAGIEVVACGFQGLKPLKNPAPLLRRFRAMYHGLASPRPDIVHCYLYWANLLGVPLGRAARATSVLASRRSLPEARGDRPALRPWEWLVERWADAVVCNGEAVRREAVRRGGAPGGTTVVIPSGVALPVAVPPPPPGPATIVVLANLIWYKGHRTLLEAYARVVEENGRHRARLVLAGRGPEEASLRDLARTLGVIDEVAFVGVVDDVSTLLAEAAFTVLPSLSEGMPNAVLESLAHGRAVVASAVGGAAEVLREGGGILVPPGDAGALAGAIGELLRDPGRARALGEAGRTLVARKYTAERMVDQTLELYRSVMQRSRGRRAE